MSLGLLVSRCHQIVCGGIQRLESWGKVKGVIASPWRSCPSFAGPLLQPIGDCRTLASVDDFADGDRHRLAATLLVAWIWLTRRALIALPCRGCVKARKTMDRCPVRGDGTLPRGKELG